MALCSLVFESVCFECIHSQIVSCTILCLKHIGLEWLHSYVGLPRVVYYF